MIQKTSFELRWLVDPRSEARILQFREVNDNAFNGRDNIVPGSSIFMWHDVPEVEGLTPAAGVSVSKDK